MPLIDDRGRLFGWFNLIDLAVFFFVLLLIPLAYGAYALFRVPPTTITGLEPAVVTSSATKQRVKLKGTNFRPFMTLVLGSAPSERYSLLVGSPGEGEFEIRENFPAGTYDLALFDEAQEIARLPNGLTVVVAPKPPQLFLDTVVKFVVGTDVSPSIKVGDEDLPIDLGPDGKPIPTARIVRILSTQEVAGVFAESKADNALPGHGYTAARSFSVPLAHLALETMVSIPVIETRTGWTYKNLPLKIGSPFSFETRTYVIGGSIVRMRLRPGEKAAPDTTAPTSR